MWTQPNYKLPLNLTYKTKSLFINLFLSRKAAPSSSSYKSCKRTIQINLKEHQLSLWSRRCQGKLKIQESVWHSLSSFFFYASKSKHKQGILLMMKVRRLFFFHFLVSIALLSIKLSPYITILLIIIINLTFLSLNKIYWETSEN